MSGERKHRAIKRTGFATALALVVCCALVAASGGCGAKKDRRSTLAPRELTVDFLLFGIVEGDSAAVLSVLPPTWLQEMRADAGPASDEEIGTMLIDALRCDFPYTEIVKISYRVADRDDGTSDVYYWGEFAEAGKAGKVKVDETEARFFNLTEINGSYYLNVK